jgi:toxin-antitoxin system PIN domain toxin
MMRALLDINVLLALFDADHVDHSRTREWLEADIGHGWASCAITQNGFVRVISQPRYPSPIPVAQAIELLSRATRSEYHEFWPCELSLLDERIVDRTRIHGPRKVTDAYLLALALAHGGRFVTFDRAIPLEAVAGAQPAKLVVL